MAAANYQICLPHAQSTTFVCTSTDLCKIVKQQRASEKHYDSMTKEPIHVDCKKHINMQNAQIRPYMYAIASRKHGNGHVTMYLCMCMLSNKEWCIPACSPEPMGHRQVTVCGWNQHNSIICLAEMQVNGCLTAACWDHQSEDAWWLFKVRKVSRNRKKICWLFSNTST